MAGKLFRSKSVEDQTTSLASFMPGGRAFLASRIPSSTLRTMLVGLATELYRADNVLNEITYEHQIDTTTSLIEEWESALGIPDHCFVVADTLAERRDNIIIKLRASGVQSEQDFIDLAELLGFTVYITAGADRGVFPLGFPAYVFDRPQSARFLMITTVETLAIPLTFAYDFPIRFGTGLDGVLECLFRIVKPANVELAFEYTLPDEGAFITEDGFYYLALEDDSLLLLE